MKRYSEQELRAFVSRADTHEKVEIAINFITKLSYIGNELYDELMNDLAYISRELYHQDRYERSYSAAAPWGAPGMRATDFYR